MARKILTFVVDDLTGEELDGDGETIRFGIDGVDYEIDLSADAARQLREEFARFVQVARKTGSTRPARKVRQEDPDRADRGKERRLEIRAWAIEQGLMSPTSRGVIGRSVVQAYQEAHR